MKGIFGDQWTSFGGNLWNGTFAVMSLLVVVTISYNLARSYNSNGLAAAIVSFTSLLMLYTGSAKDWAIPFGFLGAQGLFVSIFVAFVATELFVRLLGNKKLIIKMPEGVPPAVAKSFAALFPSMIVLFIFGFFKIFLTAVGVPDIHQAIFTPIQAPLTGVADSYTGCFPQSRVKYKGCDFPAYNTPDIKRGDILIHSSLYQRYVGELEIALKDMRNSGKTNVVGKISESEIFLLDYLESWMKFGFNEKIVF